MATTPRTSVGRKVDYPTSDGKPMAETDVHRDLMVDLIDTLRAHHAADPAFYVSGNLLVFYEEGDRRKHVSPDVLVVRGISKQRRENYLIWVEGKGPDLVIELTSRTTKSEDVKKKKALYRDVLKVPEYFLFDPFQEYLKPPMQGYRLIGDQYEPIAPVEGRLPSQILGLHLERSGTQLKLFNPLTGRWEPTSAEAERQRAEAERQRAEAERQRADQSDAEVVRLRRELEELRRRGAGGG